MRAVADIDSEAGIRALYRARGPELYRFVLRQLQDEASAAEVVQEVFVRAWRARDRFDPQVASVRVWLFAIARNATIDEARRRTARRQVAVDDTVIERAAQQDGEGAHDAAIASWVVEEALRQISEPHRVAIVETHLRGRPYAEVAAELGVPEGTMRSRVYYGLKALRLALDEMGVEHP